MIYNIEKKDYKMFESEFKVRFSKSTKIKRVLMTNGRDSYLRVDLVFPKVHLGDFNSNIKSKYTTSDSRTGEKLISESFFGRTIIYHKVKGYNIMLTLETHDWDNEKIWDLSRKVKFLPYEELYKSIK